ncbi:MAG: flagellar protein FlgN [Deferribacteres bacterium]|nr:flagellar protein FlgN [Deferribacteres bacterium]
MTSELAVENILKEQINTYKTLHDLLGRERECLLNIDAERLEEISKEKDTIVMRLRLLEEERRRLIIKIAGDRGVSAEINLRELAGITGNDVFSELRSTLLSLLQSIEEMNRFNSILIDRSINYIRTNINFLRPFTKEDVPLTSGALLSKET